mgnify:FL=1
MSIIESDFELPGEATLEANDMNEEVGMCDEATFVSLGCPRVIDEFNCGNTAFGNACIGRACDGDLFEAPPLTMGSLALFLYSLISHTYLSLSLTPCA